MDTDNEKEHAKGHKRCDDARRGVHKLLDGNPLLQPDVLCRRRSNSIPAMPSWREHARGPKDTHAVSIHTGLGPLRLRGSSSFAIVPAQQDEPAALSYALGDGRGLSSECPADGRHRDASILDALRPTFDQDDGKPRVASLAATPVGSSKVPTVDPGAAMIDEFSCSPLTNRRSYGDGLPSFCRQDENRCCKNAFPRASVPIQQISQGS